jgi:hypothetical protein
MGLSPKESLMKRKGPLSKSKPKGPFADPDVRNDWQLPGATGPKTKKRAAAMRKPPFANSRAKKES